MRPLPSLAGGIGPPAPDRRLTHWLIQLHAVEAQALFALKRGRSRVGDPLLAEHFELHIAETERHRAAVRSSLSARGQTPSRAAWLGTTVNRAGFIAYGALSRDTPGKLLADAFAYEFFEIAAYQMLQRAAAERADVALRSTLLSILRDEQEMAARLEDDFGRATAASLRASGRCADRSLIRHLRDLHALESQSGSLFAAAAPVAGSARLADWYRDQALISRTQRRRLAGRLKTLRRIPSPLKSGTMWAAGALWSAIWAAQRDTAAKLACFAFAALHLEIASYEMLRREAAEANDSQTEMLAAAHLDDERASAARLAALLDEARSANRRAT